MPTIPWRYSEMEKQTAGGPLPAWLVYGLCVVALVSFAVYVVAALYLGGDAVNGHQAAGRYYLSLNGRLTETTAAVYRYSIWHTLSLFVTHPLAGLALWLGTRKYRASRA